MSALLALIGWLFMVGGLAIGPPIPWMIAAAVTFGVMVRTSYRMTGADS